MSAAPEPAGLYPHNLYGTVYEALASQARTSPPRDDVGATALYRAECILEYIIGAQSEALQPPLLAAHRVQG